MNNRPTKKTEGLISTQFLGETIVYDPGRKRAHCLNLVVSLVWKQCDGKKSIPEIAEDLKNQTDLPIDEMAVWLAARKLSKAGLLENEIHSPKLDLRYRRKVLRTLGLVGGAAAVATIILPTPLAAVSCGGMDAPCVLSTDCCSGVCQGNHRCK